MEEQSQREGENGGNRVGGRGEWREDKDPSLLNTAMGQVLAHRSVPSKAAMHLEFTDLHREAVCNITCITQTMEAPKMGYGHLLRHLYSGQYGI